MNTPGFTAEASVYGWTVFFRVSQMERKLTPAAPVAMAGYYYCGECPLGKKQCPNPDGFGCNVCVDLAYPCPAPR